VRTTAPAQDWLDDVLTQIADRQVLFTSYAGAFVHAPRTTLDDGRDDLAGLMAAIPDITLRAWRTVDAVRIVLLLAHWSVAGDAVDDTLACYQNGDAGEQQSWLRGLHVLPDAERFLPHAIDACRTNILPVFEAISCDNPYPSRYFPELNFNQLVLKALFNGVALERVVGLAERRNAELTRMAADYAAERRAAGRAVPEDIGLAVTEPTVLERR
jgi:hypothetical protein